MQTSYNLKFVVIVITILGFFLSKIVLFILAFGLQVNKLCDLGIDDSVCSVGWAQRGTHLAVGTSNGKVQVRDD